MVGGGFGEDAAVEQPALAVLADLGWDTASGAQETFGSGGSLGRDFQSDVVLRHRLKDTLKVLNPEIPDAGLDKAIEELVESRSAMDQVRANQAVYGLLRDGCGVEVELDDGTRETRRVRFIDWDRSANNEYLAVSQLRVAGDMYNRRTDVVLFVNGIPLVLMEFKAPHVNVKAAFDDNLRDYREAIPELFAYNGFVLLSNGGDSKIGSTFAGWGHFADWKKINSEGEEGVVSLETALRGTCEPARLLDLIDNFVVYTERPGGLVKAVAKNHQYLGVNNALDALADVKECGGRLGVFWHTQGSGKSLSMLWFTQKVLRKRPGNWTFVLVTDRKELDDQLYEEFADSGVITSGVQVHAETSAHLRELLRADHRYVFTLIHKFIPEERNGEMPVLSERDDIVVITDEAHRSQYDTLAMNMRKALPNASFLGFTGTPLIAGEELTRQVFGDYVSVYNFRDSIEDGATVPLYYENRIPELQLVNDDFDEELEELLERAELDDGQEKAVSRQFSRQYHLITRSERLDEIADDVVDHFLNRGFRGKGMYVAIDKATAVRMHDRVAARWATRLAELEAEIESAPELERPPLEALAEFMRSTDMAVVVSQGQNEQADMAELGLDITPHRQRMVKEDLDSEFKDPADPFRLVFVCAMWLTGFDAPSCSTVYLDKPMRNHTLMQTIARANRVFPDKENGLIVDYVGVFRNLEDALAIYGSGSEQDVLGELPVRQKDELIAELETALSNVADFLDDHDVDLDDLEHSQGLEFVALQSSAAEALLIDDDTRRRYTRLATETRNAFKALLPDPHAQARTRRVAVIRSLAKKLASATDPPDISDVMDSVSELLDRSVGAEEYIIRTAGDADPIFDLGAIDFEQLALRFADKKRTAANAVRNQVEERLDKAVRENPTRMELAERFRRLIDEYNAGTHNIEEFLRRLEAISNELSAEETRSVREDLSEAELAIFDLLTKPEPELTAAERTQVKLAAKHLLEAITDRLVLDWRRRARGKAAVQHVIGHTLNQELPDAYGPELFDQKVQLVFDHVYSSFFDDGSSVYDVEPEATTTAVAVMPDAPIDSTEGVVERVREDPDFAARLLEELLGAAAVWAISTVDLLAGGPDENRLVEYKQTARWNVREQKKDKTMEDVVVKTVAGFLNGEGGTLLIGVDDDGRAVGLDSDYALVKPQSRDGYVNWLDTMLENALGHAGAHRVQIRLELVGGYDVCRINVPASSRPIWAKRGDEEVLFERRNNSTRAVPKEEEGDFIAERFGREHV
ncbi:MAG: HsdR family type I site-specific deoxyribonuclease [Acidimicrobiales bacterium]|nr:HsdR family type I site-specific deoxyribonuclease [Acidimicrobiales bacterium]